MSTAPIPLCGTCNSWHPPDEPHAISYTLMRLLDMMNNSDAALWSYRHEGEEVLRVLPAFDKLSAEQQGAVLNELLQWALDRAGPESAKQFWS